MTGREIERAEKLLPGWENGNPPVRTEEQKRQAEELSCRRMINSILIYWGSCGVQEGSYCYNQYLKKYEQELGQPVVARLCDEQLGVEYTPDFAEDYVPADVSEIIEGAMSRCDEQMGRSDRDIELA